MKVAVATAAVLATIAAACAPRIDRITMDPLIIRVGPAGSTVETPDPELDRLLALGEEERCEEAVPALQRFLESYPESSRFVEAVLELGACHEALGDPVRARGYFLYVASHGRGEAMLHARLRAAYALESMNRPLDAAREYREIVRSVDDEEAIAGARLRRVVCLFHAGKARAARREMPEAIRAYAAIPEPPESVRAAAAEARFADAERRARAVFEIRLEYPQRRLDRRVRQKLDALATARAAYADVVQIKDPSWAAAAVYRTGELFEGVGRELVQVPAPAAFDAAQRERYQRTVEGAAKPFKRQAFQSYLQVVALGERVGFESEWIARSRDRVKALEAELALDVLSVEPEGDADETDPPSGNPGFPANP